MKLKLKEEGPKLKVASIREPEERRTLTRNPNTCQHTEGYWNAEEDCFSCGADHSPHEVPAPVESP